MEVKFHFTHLKSKNFNILTTKSASEYFLKWSIKGQFKLTTFCFNEAFQLHEKNKFVENFFKDSAVAQCLNELFPNWAYDRTKIDNIEVTNVLCTVSSMSFFDRLLDENNDVTRGDGFIRACLNEFINEFTTGNELRRMLIDEESENYGLFNEKERSELIFQIFQFFVLGGQWCQYEDNIKPYLELTKILYKDLLRVEKNPETKKIEIKSFCLKIILKGTNDEDVFPKNAYFIQNFVFLIIDPLLRQVTLFGHEYGGSF